MKFCVMKATEGDAVVYVEAEFREESHRQDVVGLQVIPPTTTLAATIPRAHRPGPFFAHPTMPERLLDTAVHVVGVVRAGVQLREESRLRLAALARLRAGRAIPSPVLAGLAEASAHFARELLDLRVGQRPVDDIQDAFVLADGSDVSAEVLAGLEMGTERPMRLRHHPRVRLLARPAAESTLRGMFAAPGAVPFDHERNLPNTGNLSP